MAKVKYLKKELGKELNLERFPNFHCSGQLKA